MFLFISFRGIFVYTKMPLKLKKHDTGPCVLGAYKKHISVETRCSMSLYRLPEMLASSSLYQRRFPKKFFITSLWDQMTHPQGVPNLDPGVWLAGFMQGPSDIALTKYISCLPNGYWLHRRFFLKFLSISL